MVMNKIDIYALPVAGIIGKPVKYDVIGAAAEMLIDVLKKRKSELDGER